MLMKEAGTNRDDSEVPQLSAFGQLHHPAMIGQLVTEPSLTGASGKRRDNDVL